MNEGRHRTIGNLLAFKDDIADYIGHEENVSATCRNLPEPPERS